MEQRLEEDSRLEVDLHQGVEHQQEEDQRLKEDNHLEVDLRQGVEHQAEEDHRLEEEQVQLKEDVELEELLPKEE